MRNWSNILDHCNVKTCCLAYDVKLFNLISDFFKCLCSILVSNAGNSTGLLYASYPNNAEWQQYLQDLLAYIHEHLDERLSNDDLAAFCHRHPTHFIRYFRSKNLVLINKSVTPYDSHADLVINDAIGKVMDLDE